MALSVHDPLRVFAARMGKHWAALLADPDFADALAAFALANHGGDS